MLRFDEDLGVPVITSLSKLTGASARPGARVILQDADGVHSGVYDGAAWHFTPPVSFAIANLPAATGYPIGAKIIVTGAFAADVSKILLTCDLVKDVKSWTGFVVSATANNGAATAPATVTWTVKP